MTAFWPSHQGSWCSCTHMHHTAMPRVPFSRTQSLTSRQQPLQLQCSRFLLPRSVRFETVSAQASTTCSSHWLVGRRTPLPEHRAVRFHEQQTIVTLHFGLRAEKIKNKKIKGVTIAFFIKSALDSAAVDVLLQFCGSPQCDKHSTPRETWWHNNNNNIIIIIWVVASTVEV